MKIQIQNEEFKEVSNLLKQINKSCRVVGGTVRDILNNVQPKDMDIATDALPEETINIAEKNNFKTIPTGLKHGTITILVNNNPIEVTTLRIDEKTDGRHAEVKFISDWSLDAERRDFTFNAMSADLEGNVFDYFNGIEDLKNGHVNFVGNTEKRIQEDYLRILRFFRFRTRFAKEIHDYKTLDIIKRNAKNLENISIERIWMEFFKMSGMKNFPKEIKIMNELKICKTIQFPYKEENIQLLNSAYEYTKNPLIILGIMISDEKEAEKLANIWKMSNQEKNNLILSSFISKIKNNDVKFWQKMILDGYNENIIKETLNSTNRQDLSNILNKKIPNFPIKGEDLLNLGYKTGPELGSKLKELKEKWIESNYSLDKEELLNNINYKIGM